MNRAILIFAAALILITGSYSRAAELSVPKQVAAGSGFTIATGGSGQATFYLVGPNHVRKSSVQLGQEVTVTPEEVTAAGRYQAILCDSGSCTNSSFQVTPGPVAKISFLLHPSRVPVSTSNAINATAFVFDKFYNLALGHEAVEFRVTPKTGPGFSRSVNTVRGVAWMSMGSTPKEGPVKVTALSGTAAEPRVIQQVASDACNLRIKASPGKNGVAVETDPVRDCSGNAVPDGTVVSFSVVDDRGRSTVDAPIKKGIARTELPVSGRATISVASGVVMGNEISWGGKS